MGKNQYIIKFAGLPVGTHEFEFDVKSKFFEQFADSEITNTNIRVVLTLLKQNHLMQMHFKLSGTIEVECDRCLIAYDLPVKHEENLVVKFGNPKESNDEILVIPEGTGEADVSHYLYEYITLALPNRRVPCEIDSKFKCDTETLEKLNNTSIEEDEKNENPIWEQLNKLKFNKN